VRSLDHIIERNRDGTARALPSGRCNHCPGLVWIRQDGVYFCLGCGCVRFRNGMEFKCAGGKDESAAGAI